MAKEITSIDKNLLLNNKTVEEGMRYYKIPNEAFSLHGVFYDENLNRFQRMDKDVANATSENVDALSGYTSGGRLWFRTNAKKMSIRVTYDQLPVFSKMAITGQGGFLLCVMNNSGESELCNLCAPLYSNQKGFTASVNLAGDMRSYCLYFPLYNTVNTLTVGLDENAQVEAYNPYRKAVEPILYYGSSITMGGCVGRPDNAYQAMIAKWNNIDFINLGFSGSAKAEDVIVDYLAGIDCSLFVCDYDHNAPTAEYLEKTHYRLYERYRKTRPNTPILFISAPNPERHDAFGKRRNIIKKTFKKAKASGDENVWFLDGRSLLGSKDRDFCWVDGVHPNDLGFYRMATKIYQKMQEINKIFK